jgi:hypothetical protein
LYKEPIQTTQANKGKGNAKRNAKGKGNKNGKKANNNKKKTPAVTTPPPTPANVRRSNRNK